MHQLGACLDAFGMAKLLALIFYCKSLGIQTLHLGVEMHGKTLALYQIKTDLSSFNT